MIVLSATNTKLEVAASVGSVDCIASWRDVTTSGYAPGSSVATATAGTVDLVVAPAASTQRLIDYVSVYNKGTTRATVALQVDVGGTDRVLISKFLSVGERLEYVRGKGFRVLSASGVEQAGYLTGSTAPKGSRQVEILTADVQCPAGANTFGDVTGLSFAVGIDDVYWFRFSIQYSANATTTGSKWSINGPAAFSEYVYYSKYSLTSTTETTNYALQAYDSPASCNATSPSTTSNLAIIEGIFRFGDVGSVIARMASEVAGAGNITALKGSMVQYQWLYTSA